LGLGSNFELAHWYPGAPGVVSSVCASLGIGLLAGLCLAPLFHSVHPKAVAAQGAVLGAALGAFVATLPVALGADWPNVGSLANLGPTTKPFFQFVIMATCGTVGGIIAGVTGWPKLKCSRKNDTES
jgi:hypothetical protein